MGARLLELTYRRAAPAGDDARRRPSRATSCCCPTDRMGVIDFGAVAPMPGGFPIELGMTIAATPARRTTTCCCRRWKKSASSRRAEQVSVRDIDEMLRQYVEPVEVEVFHYTRKWLQRMTTSQHRPVGVADQDGPADGPAAQARDPDAGDRLGRRDPVSAGRARADQRACHEELIPGFADPMQRLSRENPAALCGREFSAVLLRGRPRGRLRFTMICPGRGSHRPTLPTAPRGPAPRPGTHVESGSRRTVPWRVPNRTGFRRTTGRDR